MKKIINCFQDALEIREELAPKQTSGWHFLYRGHASTKYELLSTAGRKQPIEGIKIDEGSGIIQFYTWGITDDESESEHIRWDLYYTTSDDEDFYI